jgi:hypothetical protein
MEGGLTGINGVADGVGLIEIEGTGLLVADGDGVGLAELDGLGEADGKARLNCSANALSLASTSAARSLVTIT